GEIAYPIREIFRNQKNTSVIMAEVSSINKEAKELSLADGSTVQYDYLILAVGAKHSYFGNNAWEEFAPGLKTIHDALSIREKILSSFEIAERLGNSPEAHKYLNFVVIGGGPTGVEMAGAIAEIANTTLFNNFRKIRPETAKIYLIEALPNILPVYSHNLSNKAKIALQDLGVIVINDKKVTNINADGVSLENEMIETKNIIWAAGNQASCLLKTLNTPLDRQGRAMVDPDLSIPNHPEIFVIGDAACAMGKDGKPLPGVAPTAIQQGKYVGQLLIKNLTKKDRPAFKYFDKGSMATIGKGKAIATVGKLEISGLLAWLAWGFIHILYLVGFKSRITVIIEWIAAFFTGQRGARLIQGTLEKLFTQTKK
ncbi:MAG: NAD(P)/FAD-dependent oxidoreductase, partial [Chlamydiae bacterium]|nr:NAD(P)/FAD-dependent oxidoreductase [Chlamydiota bacterium]